MKNNVILAGIVAVFVLLTGCTTCNSPCAKSTAPCPAHQDLKGEVGK